MVSFAAAHLLRVLLGASVVLASFVPAAAQSQATTAEINGRVVDAQGGALPGVSVTAKNPETGYTRTVVTNGEGIFLLPLLPPGTYDVTMDLAGFSTTTRRIALTVGASITYNHTLQLSAIAE